MLCLLNVGTVPTLCILNVGTVPTFSSSLLYKRCFGVKCRQVCSRMQVLHYEKPWCQAPLSNHSKIKTALRKEIKAGWKYWNTCKVRRWLTPPRPAPVSSWPLWGCATSLCWQGRWWGILSFKLHQFMVRTVPTYHYHSDQNSPDISPLTWQHLLQQSQVLTSFFTLYFTEMDLKFLFYIFFTHIYHYLSVTKTQEIFTKMRNWQFHIKTCHWHPCLPPPPWVLKGVCVPPA